MRFARNTQSYKNQSLVRRRQLYNIRTVYIGSPDGENKGSNKKIFGAREGKNDNRKKKTTENRKVN
jgi:hypothetical protein